MRQVLLVHGINSNGDWQDAVEHVLDPHFEVVKIRYWQYRWLGAFKLVLEPWALILAGAAIYFLATRFLPACPVGVSMDHNFLHFGADRDIPQSCLDHLKPRQAAGFPRVLSF